MYCNIEDIESESCKKMNKNNLSVNDYRRNSFLFLQDNKYRQKVNSGVASSMNTGKINTYFFSEENIRKIQELIKKELYDQTKGKFILTVDQDEESLIISMKSVYAEYGNYRSVDKINRKVIEFIMPDILNEIRQYDGYIKKINSPLKPMDRPINVNNKGRNQLRSITTVWK